MEDELIPVEMGQRLRDIDPRRIELTDLEGVGHREAILSQQFPQAMERLLSRAER